jgi:hypothetical protein
MNNTHRNEALRNAAGIAGIVVATLGCSLLAVAMLADSLVFAGVGLLAAVLGSWAAVETV